jgi:threonyl-tRNA synthetase
LQQHGADAMAAMASRAHIVLPAWLAASERREPVAEITLTFPDGARRKVPKGITGTELASSISKSLARMAVAMVVDGRLADLADGIEADAVVKIVTREDPEALELIRHDCAHVMAEAVQDLYPGTQVTIGPVIENGFFYDFHRSEPFHPDDLPRIEARMREIIARNAPFTKEVWDREQAKAFFRDKGETFKVELVDTIPPGENVKIYKQGTWLDLCRGPHMTATGQVGRAFKLMKTAGSYWRGDAKNAQLQRIYGTAWASEAGLVAYLKQLEEAEKRDHRKLGREMDLFHFQEDAPGTVFWHPKGWTLFQTLIAYMRRRQNAEGYVEVNSPQLLDRSLWETSGHWEKYRELMFVTETEDERVFALKPMNCPGHVQIYKHGLRSYRELPLKIAEFGSVHRYEPSGALHGLMRVRAFTQDDAHIFCTPEQIRDECMKVNAFMLSIYEDFEFTELTIKLATRPDKRVGSDHLWDAAEAALGAILDEVVAAAGGKIKRSINPGEGTFYGPKFEYVLRDAIGRDWQCGTLQLDFNLPQRFGAFYIDGHGEKKTPVMLHRAMFGSLERFTGILIENTAGHLPLWLSPLQVMVCTIVSDADRYAGAVLAALRAAGLRAEADLRNEKINYKVREHSHAKVPVLLVAGKREAEQRTVSIRRLGQQEQTVLPLEEAVRMLAEEAVPPDVRRVALPVVPLIFVPDEYWDGSRNVVVFHGRQGGTRLTFSISEEALDDHFGAEKLGPIEAFRRNREAIEQKARTLCSAKTGSAQRELVLGTELFMSK